jgi:uncharacterized protein YcsI (UPF0317 family)
LNPAISYSEFPALKWAAFWDGNFTVGRPLMDGRGVYKQKYFGSTKTLKEKVKTIWLFFWSCCVTSAAYLLHPSPSSATVHADAYILEI